MSFSNPYKHPTFERIKDKYRCLKEPHKAVITELEQAKEAIWQESIEHKILSPIGKWPTISRLIVFGVLLLLSKDTINQLGRTLPGWLITSLILLAYILLPYLAAAILTNIRNNVIERNRERLRPYEERVENSKQELCIINKAYNAEWTSTCETFNGYPPDWKDRCAIVKSRDGYACTECGYPTGFKRRTRELHVHHITAISEGGTNDVDNLITLCHICHPKVDSKHHGVKRIIYNKRLSQRWR